MNKSDIAEWLNKETANRSTDSTACYVTMDIGYDSTNGNVDIRFGEATNRTGNYLSIKAWVPLEEADDSASISVKFACSTHNTCDRDFISKWDHVLADKAYQRFQNRLLYIFALNANFRKCGISKKPVGRSNQMCAVTYNAAISDATYRQHCMRNILELPSLLFLTMQTVDLGYVEPHVLGYVCKSAECHNEWVFHWIMSEFRLLCSHIQLTVFFLREANARKQMAMKIEPMLTETDQERVNTRVTHPYLVSVVLLFGIINFVNALRRAYWYRASKRRGIHQAAVAVE